MPAANPKVSLTKRFTKSSYVFLILAVAAYLRLRGLQYGKVAGDQSVLLDIAMRWVNGGMIPLAANKSSAGIMNPPLIEYLLALPLFVHPTIGAAQLFQALLSVAAVLILYVYTSRLFGHRVAAIAGLLLAVNPWAVYYGRFLWNPNPIPFFSTLLLMHLITTFAGERRPFYLGLSFLWLAAITQLHLSGLVLVGVVGVIGLIFWRRWWQDSRRRALTPVLVGLLLALLLYAPFIVYERAVGFTDLQAIANSLTGGRIANAEVGEPVVNTASWLLTLELATGNDFWNTTAVPRAAIWQWFWLADAARILVIAGFLYALVAPIVHYRKTRTLPPRQTALLILALWTLIPVLLYLRHTVYLQNYYFLYLYPAPFLAIGLMVDDVLKKLETGDWRLNLKASNLQSPISNLLILSPILLLALWQFNISHTRLGLLDEGKIGPEQQARHVEQAIAASRAILSRYPNCDLTVVSQGGSLESSRLSVLEAFVHPTPVRYVDAGRGYIRPANCTIYMTAVSDPLINDFLVTNGAPQPEQVQAGQETWRFFHVPGLTTAVSEPLAIWQNGLALVKARIDGAAAPGAQLTVTYTWQVTAVPPHQGRIHFFNHFLDEAGQLIAQEDAPAIDSRYWQPGDQLVTQFYLPMPPEMMDGRYTLYTGLYTWPSLERVPLLNGETVFPAAELASE